MNEFLEAISSDKRVYFFSDTHFREHDCQRALQIQNFLLQRLERFDTVVFLGDMVEFIVGSNTVVCRHYKAFNALIVALASHGKKLIYVEGNHEYSLVSHYGHHHDLIIVRDFIYFPINGKRALLCHGDMLFQPPIAYRIFRALTKGALFAFTARFIPGRFFLWLAFHIADYSRNHPRSHRFSVDQIIDKIVANAAQDTDIIIFGHFHRSTKVTIGTTTGYCVFSMPVDEKVHYLTMDKGQLFYDTLPLA